MKNYTIIAIILGVIFIFSSESANAQTIKPMRTEIPFQFSVGEYTFEPGKYIIEQINSESGQPILRLHQRNEKRQAIIFTFFSSLEKVEGKNKTILKFNRYGDPYFLSGISYSKEGFSLGIEKSRNEIELAKIFKLQKPADVLISLSGKK